MMRDLGMCGCIAFARMHFIGCFRRSIYDMIYVIFLDSHRVLTCLAARSCLPLPYMSMCSCNNSARFLVATNTQTPSTTHV